VHVFLLERDLLKTPSGSQCTESWKQGKFCHGHGGDKPPPFHFQSWQPCNGTDKMPRTIPQLAIATWQKSVLCFTCGINLKVTDHLWMVVGVFSPTDKWKTHPLQSNLYITHYSLIMSFFSPAHSPTNPSHILTLGQKTSINYLQSVHAWRACQHTLYVLQSY